MANRGYPNNNFEQFINSGGEVAGKFSVSSVGVGFFGTAPHAQIAANADTSGATLVALETEVNELKQALRDLGFMAP